MGRLDATVNSLFTFAFATELLFNIFANFSKRFFRNGWNWFDVIIVLVSLAGQGLSSFPDWLVKLMRAFRVIRLFGRVKAHHPPLHLCVPPARRPSARPSPFPFFGARFGDAARR